MEGGARRIERYRQIEREIERERERESDEVERELQKRITNTKKVRQRNKNSV